MNVGKLKNFKVWCKHPEDPTVKVQISYIPQDEYDEIYDECNEIVMDEAGNMKLTPEGLPEIKHDAKKYRSKLARRAITGWEGYTDGDDEHPYPFTPENIDTLMEIDGGLRKLVRTTSLSFQSMLMAEKAALGKN